MLALKLVLVILIMMLTNLGCTSERRNFIGNRIELPVPNESSDISVEEALLQRRSIRQYSQEPLKLQEVSQLLWSAQGVTNERGYRTAPSAGATFPLQLYIVAGNVEGLDKGVYLYDPDSHSLGQVEKQDVQPELHSAALRQSPVLNAPILLVFTAIYDRTTGHYGERGIRYVHNEVGHAAQNVHLQVISMEMGTVVIGAFRDNAVKEIMNLPENEEPLYIMPVGKL